MSRHTRNGALLRYPCSRREAHLRGTIAITPLARAIGKGGFELTLIRRSGRAAIYRQHLLHGNPDHDAYEVILPQVRNTNHNGEPVSPYEGYPLAESWGKKGWTFTSLTKAVEKLERLAQKAPCAGTVSRRNRRKGRQASLVARHNFISQRNHMPVQRGLRLARRGTSIDGSSQGIPIQGSQLVNRPVDLRKQMLQRVRE